MPGLKEIGDSYEHVFGHRVIWIGFGFWISDFGFLTMPLRLAAVTSLVVFAVCLIAGSDNTFGTAVSRALVAMGGTLGLGLIVGWMGQKMIDENVKQQIKVVPDASEVSGEITREASSKKPEAKRTDNKAPELKKSDNRSAKSAVKKDGAKPATRGR
jgi:hypothetical protein